MTDAIPVQVPGSKSLTIRALTAASLAEGTSTLEGPLVSDDTNAALRAFRSLGSHVEISDESWEVEGFDGSPSAPGELIDVGESGLTARILIAVSALVEGEVGIGCRGRLSERPMQEILDSITSQGAVVSSPPGVWPLVLRGVGTLAGGEIEVDISRTTQALTGLLLVAPYAATSMTLKPIGARGSQGYIQLSIDVLEEFGGRVAVESDSIGLANDGLVGTTFVVEPDASAAVYPMVAAAITGLKLEIIGLGRESHQPDAAVATHLAEMGCEVEVGASSTVITGPGRSLSALDADLSGSPDGAIALAVAALFANQESRLRGLHSLRDKESDRIDALATELSRVGGGVVVAGDDLIVTPGQIQPVQVSAHGDHRIAMSFGLLSLVQPAMSVADPNVVSKTWPGFWDMIAELRRELV